MMIRYCKNDDSVTDLKTNSNFVKISFFAVSITSMKIKIKLFSNTLSILGHRIPDVPVPLFGVYPASKYALTAMVQTIRQELQFHKANIKVTVREKGLI